MKFIARPIIVDAFRIETIAHCGLGHIGKTLTLEDGREILADSAMLARIDPEPGDYYVVQEDGYAYLNPAAVFLRKYEPLPIPLPRIEDGEQVQGAVNDAR